MVRYWNTVLLLLGLLVTPAFAMVTLLGPEEALHQQASPIAPDTQQSLYNQQGEYQALNSALLAQLYPRPQLLWFAHNKSRQLRAQLRWLLLENRLAGGPAVLGQWWQVLEAAPDDPLNEQLYTDAFLGLLAYYQSLMSLDYAQSMSLSGLAQHSLVAAVDHYYLQNLSAHQLLQQLEQWRGEQSIALLHYKQQVLYWYQQHIAEPWPNFSYRGLLRIGDRRLEVLELRRQLQRFNPAWQASQTSDVFDEQLERWVMLFQQRHGLKQDGIVGQETYYWLSMLPLQRAQLMARNRLRQRLLLQFIPDAQEQRVVVNVPAYQLSVFSRGHAVLESKVVVGRSSRATPMLVSEINNVVVNPYWNVPRKIVRKDILPKLRQDPSYVNQNNFELFNYQGDEVSQEQVDWQNVKQTGSFPYRMRQRPGPGNALGKYKFHFANDFAVYLHDTSAPELFEHDSRAYSSGCIRVEEADFLAEFLLEQSGYSAERREYWLASGRSKWLSLRKTVPVYLVYFTSWIDQHGVVQYRRDIYDYDKSSLADGV